MASLIKYADGLRRIDFATTTNGPRRSVRLGRMNAKNAAAVLAKVEIIIADKRLSRPHEPETCEWLANADEWLLKRLRAVGLADGVGVTQTTLGAFLARAFESLSVKPSTATFYGHTKRNLLDYFGAGRLLTDITESDADAWRAWLATEASRDTATTGPKGLSRATVARRVVAARTFWRIAVRWKLTGSNPFDGVKSGTQQNEGRKRFIAAGIITAIMDNCPDVQWRAMIALARFGGLRCPSEVLAVTWADVDWGRGTLRVRSAKTEHHDGHAARTVPLFPELRSALLDCFEHAEPGTERVIADYPPSTPNLRTQFHRIIRRAGFEPWPRLWQNLRASRESELMREYDLATVCKWIGNSPAVAAKHYAMSVDLDSDFRRAAGLPEAQQKAQQSPAASGGHAVTSEPGEAHKTLENKGDDDFGQLVAKCDEASKWADWDSNPGPTA